MRRCALLLLAASLFGCQSTTDEFTLGPTDANVAGAFGLALVNGGELPIVARLSNTERWELYADTLRISGDSAWTETSYYNITAFSDGSVTKTQSIASGVYVVADKQINFTMRVGGSASFIGAVQGSTLTLVFNENHFIYSR